MSPPIASHERPETSLDVEPLTRREADDREQRAAREHLHARAEQQVVGQPRPAGVEGADRPGDRCEEADQRAEEVDVAARPDQQRDPDEADDHADDGQRPEPPPVRGEVEGRDPEREGRDDQRRHARVDPLLRNRDERVSADEQERADDRRRDPVLEGRPLLRGRKIAKRIAPATRKRSEAMRNGGIDSIAISIPRYVAPQMT